MWDKVFYPPRRVVSFYSKSDLEWVIQKRTERKDTRNNKVNPAIAGRSYQIEAIKRVSERYEKGHRKALLVMATGTGNYRKYLVMERNERTSYCINDCTLISFHNISQ
jgi:type I restriction enzyme R subunit